MNRSYLTEWKVYECKRHYSAAKTNKRAQKTWSWYQISAQVRKDESTKPQKVSEGSTLWVTQRILDSIAGLFKKY